jgi:hypothetical protein
MDRTVINPAIDDNAVPRELPEPVELGPAETKEVAGGSDPGTAVLGTADGSPPHPSPHPWYPPLPACPGCGLSAPAPGPGNAALGY